MLEDRCERLDVLSNRDKNGEDSIGREGEGGKISHRNDRGEKLSHSIT